MKLSSGAGVAVAFLVPVAVFGFFLYRNERGGSAELAARVDRLEQESAWSLVTRRNSAQIGELHGALMTADVIKLDHELRRDEDTGQTKIVGVPRQKLWFCVFLGVHEPALFGSCFRYSEDCRNNVPAGGNCIAATDAWCFVDEREKRWTKTICYFNREYCERVLPVARKGNVTSSSACARTDW